MSAGLHQTAARSSLLGLPVLAWTAIVVIAVIVSGHDAHAARPRALCRRRQSDRRRLCRHRCRAHPLRRLRASPARSPGSAAISGSRATRSPMSTSPAASSSTSSPPASSAASRSPAASARWRRRARRAVPRHHQERAAGHQHLALLADGDLRLRDHPRRGLQCARQERRQGRIILRERGASEQIEAAA